MSGPNVCRIHEFFVEPAHGDTAAIAFLTMELLNGITLSERPLLTAAARDELPELEVVARDVVRALGELHGVAAAR